MVVWILLFPEKEILLVDGRGHVLSPIKKIHKSV